MDKSCSQNKKEWKNKSLSQCESNDFVTLQMTAHLIIEKFLPKSTRSSLRRDQLKWCIWQFGGCIWQLPLYTLVIIIHVFYRHSCTTLYMMVAHIGNHRTHLKPTCTMVLLNVNDCCCYPTFVSSLVPTHLGTKHNTSTETDRELTLNTSQWIWNI